MFPRTSWSCALVAVTCLGSQAAGQTPPPPDLRLLSLRALHAGQAIRVSGHDLGTVSGSVQGVHDGALWLHDQPQDRQVSIAQIDSVWVGRNRARTGAIVGGLIGGVAGVVAVSGKTCQVGDSACLSGGILESTVITVGGLLLGALIGSGTRSWQLRFP
jgi:hypothetical protein